MKIVGKACKQGIMRPRIINQVAQTWEVNKLRFEQHGAFLTVFNDVERPFLQFAETFYGGYEQVNFSPICFFFSVDQFAVL